MTQDPTRADFEEDTETKMRDDFEECVGQVALLERAGKNGYKLLSTNIEWVAFRAGWQAATKHQSENEIKNSDKPLDERDALDGLERYSGQFRKLLIDCSNLEVWQIRNEIDTITLRMECFAKRRRDSVKHQSDKCAGLAVALHELRGCCNLPENNDYKISCMVNADKALKEHRDSVEGGA